MYEYTSTTFGVRNAGQTFQRNIYQALGELEFVNVYIDDILIATANDKEHKKHLREVFEKLKQCGLRINPAKCEFRKSEIEFLGYMVDRRSIKPTKEKVRAILNYPNPKTVPEQV